MDFPFSAVFTQAMVQDTWLPVLASALFASLWQSAALVCGAGCALRLLPGLSSTVKSAAWTAVFFLAAALPFTRMLPARATSAHAAVWHAGEPLCAAFVALWLAAANVRLVQLLLSAAHLRRVLRRAQPFSPSLAAAARWGGASRTVALCTSTDVDRPSVAGFLRPRILLPPELLATLPETDLEQILLHEREHLRRGDHWINLLAQVGLVLMPLNPALFWLNRRLALERELACDDSVLRSTGARKAYAACLARVAERSLVHRGLTLALGVLGSRRPHRNCRPELSRRVERILAAPQAAMTRGQTRLAGGALCLFLAGAATALAHSPALVSFGPATPSAVTLAGNGDATGDRLPLPEGQSAPEPRPLLVKAVLPGGARSFSVPLLQRSSCLSRRAVRLRHVSTPFAVSGTGRRLTPAPRAVLTAWPADASRALTYPQPSVVPVVRLTPVRAADAEIWYTAVRWQGGWLLVQI